MARLKIQSVKFKKDYMMFSAFLLFFAIVAAEFFLAIWLPWHLRLEHMWAEQVARQELIDAFDALRSTSRKYAEEQSLEAKEEAALLHQSLESSAAFMHQNGRYLTPEQCRDFMNILKRLQTQSADLGKGKAYSHQEKISYDAYLSKIRGRAPAQKKKK